MTTAAAQARYPLTQGVNPWLVTVSVMLPTFMEVLDTAIASVALPYIAGSLSASNSEATWVLTSYLVANAVILPASNWFARRFGRKRFLLICVIIFTVASFFCGAAPSLGVILLARVMQGAGGGALQPLSQSILLESFPIAEALHGHGRLWPGHRGRAGDRSHPGRLAHRYLQLALRLLHQHSRRHSGGLHDHPLRPRSALHQERQGRPLRQHRLRPAHGLDRLPADRPGQGPGRRLVRRHLGALGGRRAGRLARLAGSGTPGPIPNGLVDLHVLKDRNFRTGCFLIAMLGMCIYITIAILPLYYQEVLGYTAFTAGLVVGPRGIGSFIGSPVIGFLGSRIDNRKLLCAGFLGFGVCALIFGTVNLDIGPYTLLIPITLTGFALSFVFVPLATMTTSTIPREEMGNATGLFNMLRNIGGSIGIAMATTALIRRAALHQTEIGANLTPSTMVLQQKSAAIAGYLGHHIGPAQARPGSFGLLYGLMQQQSALMAYVDVFRWTALLAFFCAVRRLALQKADRSTPRRRRRAH